MADMADDKPVSAYVAYQRIKQQQQQQPAPKPTKSAMEQDSKQSDRRGAGKKRNRRKKRQASSAADEATESSKKAKLHEAGPDGPRGGKAAPPNGTTVSSKNKRKKQWKQPAKVASADSDESGEAEAEADQVIDPMVEATEVFKEIIAPLSTEQFFGTYWERKPLLVKRGAPDHYADWFSSSDLDRMLRDCRVMFGEHLDVTSYRDGKRETHNPDGRALPAQVWQFYQSGCSLRLLCPQVFHERVYQKLSILHELFGAFVGANVYLTPPGTQGFAPHWDDIEAFVMQLEGRKHWRVYAPRGPAERLPRESSGNFGPKDHLGQPVIDAVLEPGDLLYMPRGFIHQGRCLDGWHSLHITVSTYQKFTWADLLSEALSGALERAARDDVEFRRGLPLGLLGFAGSAFAEVGDGRDGKGWAARRRQADDVCKSLLARLAAHLDVDEAADKLACQQVRDALPPALDPSEAARSAHGAGPGWDARRCRSVPKSGGGGSDSVASLTGASRVRLIRRSAARACLGSGRLHTSLGNTRVFREADPAYLEVDPALAPGLAALAAAYPAFLTVDQLPVPDPEERLGLALSLYESGLLVSQDLPPPEAD